MLIISLCEEIFDKVTKQMAKWMESSTHQYHVAINLSVITITTEKYCRATNKIIK